MVWDSPNGILGYKTLLREGSCAAVFCGGGKDSVSFLEFGCGALEDDAGYVHAGYVGEWLLQGFTRPYLITLVSFLISTVETDVSKECKRVGNHLGSDMNLLVNSTGIKDKDFFINFKPDMKQRNSSIMESLLNVAILDQRPLEDIGKLMKTNGEGNLSRPDECGWTALHYACRHMSDNDHLVHMLLEHSPDAVSTPDQFNRCPLHLACDSGKTSINVIKLLLEAAGEIVMEPTLHLEVSPNKNMMTFSWINYS